MWATSFLLGVAGVSVMNACGDGAAVRRASRPDSMPATSVTSDTEAANVHGSGLSADSDSLSRQDVAADMQNVNLHMEPGIVLRIRRLRGTVRSTHAGVPPALNDKRSMIIAIASGDIALDTASLSNLLNRHVFKYAGSPLRNLHVSVKDNQMVQTGSLKKGVWLPFRITSDVSLTDQGLIRVRPTAISMFGLGVKGLSRRLGGIGGLISLAPGHGARIDGNDFLLDPEAMLPPPAIRGRLTSVRVEPGGLRQTFGGRGADVATPLRRIGSTARNYMYFHGGTLRFGKLTMRDTDLEIVDGDPSNPFDYALDRYQDHLVAGHSNTTAADGLVVVMPDVQQLRSRNAPTLDGVTGTDRGARAGRGAVLPR